MFLLALTPALSFAQSTSQVQLANGQPSQTQIGTPVGFNGIFSCNQTGANAMSVGALGATGGVYVPVADASVELNTGTLVYKECVLREVVDAQKQAATAGFGQQATNNILTGRNGSPQFAQYQTKEMNQVGTNAMKTALQSIGGNLDPNNKAAVEQGVAQGYSTVTYNAQSMVACPYPGATTAFTNSNSQFSWNNILAVGSPCNPLFAYVATNDLTNGYIAQEQNCLQNQWLWGGGFYSVTTGTGGPCEQQIVTPSSLVNSSYSTIVNSGYNQLQSANDIGQMVGALFAGLSTQILSGTGGGITGLNQSFGGSPSYLQQVVSQETQNLQSTVANAALANLEAALQVEQSYYNIMSTIAGTLEGTIGQLRGAENTCWNQLITTICATGSVQTNSKGVTTCTGTNGSQFTIATSTEFSQPVINSQIEALASTTANNLQVSQQALALINQLIQNVSGTSPDSQALAIQQLNTLISNKELHTSADLTTAQGQSQAISNAMQTLSQNTPQLWAGTDPNNTTNNNIPWNGSVGPTMTATDPGVGWCNFKNQTTIQAWKQAWGG